MNILVVINDAFFSNKIKSILQEQDDENNYFFTASYADAVDILDNNEIKILVCDAIINKCNGIELLEYARMTAEKIIKIVIADEKSIDTLIEMINSEGIYRFILKPIHMVNDIINPINDAIKKAKEIEALDYKKITNMNDSINYSRVIDKVIPKLSNQDISAECYNKIIKLLFESNIVKKDLHIKRDNYRNYNEFFKEIIGKFMYLFLERDITFDEYISEFSTEYGCKIKTELDCQLDMDIKLKCLFVVTLLLEFIRNIMANSKSVVYIIKRGDKFLVEITHLLENADYKCQIQNNKELYDLFKFINTIYTKAIKLTYEDNIFKIKALI